MMQCHHFNWPWLPSLGDPYAVYEPTPSILLREKTQTDRRRRAWCACAFFHMSDGAPSAAPPSSRAPLAGLVSENAKQRRGKTSGALNMCSHAEARRVRAHLGPALPRSVAHAPSKTGEGSGCPVDIQDSRV